MATIEVSGMGCDGCEDIVENAVSEVAGVSEVDADHENGEVEYDGDVDREAVEQAIEYAGYETTAEA